VRVRGFSPGPRPVEAPAGGAKAKAKAKMVSPGVQSGAGARGGGWGGRWGVDTAETRPGRPRLSSCGTVRGRQEVASPAALTLCDLHPRPTDPPDRDCAMRGRSVALWFFLSLRTGEARPPGGEIGLRAGVLVLSSLPSPPAESPGLGVGP
jgi:hypothetical protein